MILAVNIGNTNIAIGFFNDNNLTVKRYSHKKCELHEEFVNSFRSDISATKEITSIAIASVVPRLTHVISYILLKETGKQPLIIDTSMDLGLDFSAYDSSLLGIDRLLCCVAALKKYESPAIIFDLGTAITVNVINKEACFIGGVILPGVQMGLEALTKGTALLPKGDLLAPSTVIGNNTATCLTSGAIYGTASIIEGMARRIEDELGYKCLAIITGGNAEDIIPYSDVDLIYEPNLLLEGIKEIVKV